MERTILLARHGATPWTLQGRYQGQAPVPLSEAGRRAARALARRLPGPPPDAVVTSDLPRAAQTAAILAERSGLSPVPEPRLRERDCGGWTGLTGDEVRERFPAEVAALGTGADVAKGGGETLAEVHARSRAWLAEALAADWSTLLVVTHDGPIRVLLETLAGADAAGSQPLASVRVVTVGTGGAARVAEPVAGEDEPQTWVPPL